MIVLDENFPAGQRDLLVRWGIRFRQIGRDVGASGMTDENIVPLLRQLAPATLFSRDLGLYRRELRDPRFGIACLAVREDVTAAHARRLLRHPMFRTESARVGRVCLVSFEAIRFWAPVGSRELRVGWTAPR